MISKHKRLSFGVYYSMLPRLEKIAEETRRAEDIQRYRLYKEFIFYKSLEEIERAAGISICKGECEYIEKREPIELIDNPGVFSGIKVCRICGFTLPWRSDLEEKRVSEIPLPIP